MKALRLSLYFLVGLLLGTVSVLSFAGSFQSYQGSAYRNINGTSYYKGDTGALSGSAVTELQAISIGGTYMTIPTLAQITSGAAALAMTGIRSSPAIASASVLAWLAQQGIQYLDGRFQSLGDSVPTNSGYPTGTCSSAPPPCGFTGTCSHPQLPHSLYQYFADTPGDGWSYVRRCGESGNPGIYNKVVDPLPSPCNAGYELRDGICVPTTYTDAQQSDWDRVNGVTPPDDVMKDLCQSLAKYNTTTPGCAVFNARTTGVTTPLSDWTTGPDGVQRRKVAKWKPSPTADDPFRGEVSIEEEVKTTTTTTDPNTGETSTTTDTTSTDKTPEDLCQLHPDILACSKLGDPEDSDVDTDTKNVSINPDGGWMTSGTCPADKSITVHGVTLVFKYQPMCDVAGWLRPVVIGLGWLTAILTFMGISRRVQG